MKRIISIAFLILVTVVAMAQNQKISYQMVVRNAANEIVANTGGIEVTITLLDANNGTMYSEKHTVTTDDNGLVAFFIGEGNVLSGDYSSVSWADASIETKLAVPGETEVSSTQKLGAMPHALYAAELNLQFLEDYLASHGFLDSLAVRDSISAILGNFQHNTAAYLNDANYLTEVHEMQVLSIVGDTLFISNGNHIVLPANFNGDYNDLTNKPLVPDSTSQMFNDAGFLTLTSMPDTVSYFLNDTGYLTRDSLSNIINRLSEMLYAYDTLSAIIASLQHNIDSLNAGIDAIEDSFPCLTTPTVTDYESNVYHTVQIGHQCWMKENLRSTKYADGRSIALGDTTSLDSAYRYYPDQTASNVATYGYLYNWAAVMDAAAGSSEIPSGVQGLCPTGWHVPSYGEWLQMLAYLGTENDFQCQEETNIAKALAAKTAWNTSEVECAIGHDLSANNATGFGMMPAGLHEANNTSAQFNDQAHFWTATQESEGKSYGFVFDHATPTVYSESGALRSEAHSLRCIKD